MSKIYIVGTPIGNMKDITYRAIEILKEVDLIACEDTRVTKKLLDYWNIKKKLLVYNKFNEKNSAKGIINKLNSENINLALVSDAGMPLISDPGFDIIKEARNNNIEIELIPGVNAAISTFVLSAFASEFIFLGFPKEKISQREKQIRSFVENYAYIFYVAPHKLLYFIDEIDKIWNDRAQIFLAKELTKMFEKHYTGSPKEIKKLLEKETIKGEFTLVLKLKTHKRIKVNKYAKKD
ncbi:16S rRNA (cytidine(1402)-2'-O)-methyltransferase [Mycoplasmopsis meleagridis]|uniref:16S rRNA (cytidine(1402)-2'-O)-methyltransferase n=1 Tax=Mycoplasmopsis meleagridis TaxID=29561 RepID=UPI00073DAF19|nr:16S rRNA (cytidine(1402)-2'-O)-methyltransferase [Mycoplasmopsis meleagridis]KUH47187.1 16S rRNA methyltransferase [Mycoplasmopsis meleagridis]